MQGGEREKMGEKFFREEPHAKAQRTPRTRREEVIELQQTVLEPFH